MTKASKIGADTEAKPRAKPPNAGLGRPPGSVNKTTAAVKGALLAVYADLQGEAEDASGPNAHLKTWAKANPTEFYKLWARLLPTEVSGPDGEPVGLKLTDDIAALPKERRDQVRKALMAALGSARD